eukprot:4187166-Prymnesium_polylepis.1
MSQSALSCSQSRLSWPSRPQLSHGFLRSTAKSTAPESKASVSFEKAASCCRSSTISAGEGSGLFVIKSWRIFDDCTNALCRDPVEEPAIDAAAELLLKRSNRRRQAALVLRPL